MRVPKPQELVPKLRPEPDLKGRWGIFSVSEEQWMAVVYATQREALEGIRIVTDAQTKGGGTTPPLRRS
jgi:hypothetical protein